MTKQTPSTRRALSSLIENWLWLVMAGSRTFARDKRAPPPVSNAPGGPMPGIDLSCAWKGFGWDAMNLSVLC
jgi:hypothetical protein